MKKILVAIVFFAIAAIHAKEQVSYLKIGGVDGDSQTPGHRLWFELSSFDQGPYRWTKKGGARNLLPKDSGVEGSGALTVARLGKTPSLELYQAASHGIYFGTVSIDIPINSGIDQRFIHWTLSDVVVTGFSVERAHGKRGLPMEQITLSYQSARWDLPDAVSLKRNPQSSH